MSMEKEKDEIKSIILFIDNLLFKVMPRFMAIPIFFEITEILAYTFLTAISDVETSNRVLD